MFDGESSNATVTGLLCVCRDHNLFLPNTTLALYAQAIPENVRRAQGKVVEMVRKVGPYGAKPRVFIHLCPNCAQELKKSVMKKWLSD